VDTPDGRQSSSDATEERQGEAFRQQLSNQASPIRAEGRAERHLFLTHRRPGE